MRHVFFVKREQEKMLWEMNIRTVRHLNVILVSDEQQQLNFNVKTTNNERDRTTGNHQTYPNQLVNFVSHPWSAAT